MCLILFAFKSHPAYKLVIAANRDEFYARQTKEAGWWPDSPEVLGGRDAEAGGTWMGMSDLGKISMVTNYRDPANIRDNAPSRGHLVSEFLKSDKEADEYLRSLVPSAKSYNGFNLLAGNQDRLFYLSNYHDGVNEVTPGLHGLSNHLLETPWPKVVRGKAKLGRYLKNQKLSPGEIFDMLYDDQTASDGDLPDTGIGKDRERALSPMFIKTSGYGTRCSTVVLINHQNEVTYAERVYDVSSWRHTTRTYEFAVPLTQPQDVM